MAETLYAEESDARVASSKMSYGRTIYLETLKKLIRNSKTHIFLGFMILGILLYTGFILPNTQPMDTVDLKRLDIDMQANQSIMESKARSGNTEASAFTGQSAYLQAKYKYNLQRSFKTAIDSGDAHRLIQLNYIPEYLDKEITEYYLANSEHPLKDLGFDRTNQGNRLNSYIEEVPHIDFHLIQEKTAWQQLHTFFLNWGPLILGFSAIFLVSDVTTRERQEKTQKAGIPYSWKKYLFAQSLASFTFVLSITVIGLSLFWLSATALFGTGSTLLKVPQYLYSTDFTTNTDVFGLMSIGSFMIRVVPYFLLFTYLLIRLSTIFSLWFKQDVIVMVAGFFVLFFEKLYFDRRMTDLFNIPLGFFPQTYVDYGKVITGEKSYLLNTDSITFQRGLIVLGLTLVLVEVLLWITATVQTRQKYVE